MNHLFTHVVIAALFASGMAGSSDHTARLSGSMQDENTRLRRISIEAQPDAPLLLRNLSVTFNPEAAAKPSLFDRFDLKLAFYVDNRSSKFIVSYTYSLREADGNAALLATRLRELSPYAVIKEEDVSTFAEGRSLVLRVDEVIFEDGTNWKAKLIPLPGDESKP